MKKVLGEEMEKAFRPEFINRLDDTIVFRQLNREDLKGIVKIQTSWLEERMKEKGFELGLSEAAYEALIDKGFNPDFGARPLRRAIERYLEDPLSEHLLAHRFSPPARIVVTPQSEEEFHFEAEGLDEWPKTKVELERARKAKEKAEQQAREDQEAAKAAEEAIKAEASADSGGTGEPEEEKSDG
jgi:hypothetical protein